VAKLLRSVPTEVHMVPPRLLVIYFHARTLDFIQFNRIDDLAKLMGSTEPIFLDMTEDQQRGSLFVSKVCKQSCASRSKAHGTISALCLNIDGHRFDIGMAFGMERGLSDLWSHSADPAASHEHTTEMSNKFLSAH
jgi:hypothetical protein